MGLMQRFGVFVSTVLLVLSVSVFALPTSSALAQSGSLSVNPTSAPQNSTVTFTLAGFGANETVSLWVTFPDAAVMAVGDVVVTDKGDATLNFFLGSDLPTGVHYFSARGNRTQRLAKTRFELKLGQGAPASPGVQIKVDSVLKPQGYCFVYTGNGYRANETLSVWLRTPANEIADMGKVMAAGNGTFQDEICFGSLAPEGMYYFTAYGNTSTLTGIATFNLRRGDYIEAPTGSAKLSVEPASARQLDVVKLKGSGFLAGETVSLWVTLPDGIVLTLYQGVTVNGGFTEEIQLPPLPVGRHYFSAYGHTSGLRAVAAFDLLPGDGK